MSFLFQSSLQKGVNVCATSKTFLWQPKKKNLVIALFGRYLRIKPHDNMLIFLFAKTRGSSLIQHLFLSHNYTIFHQICYFRSVLSFFWNYYPPGQLRIFQNQLLISNHDVIHLLGSFAGFLICLCEQKCRKQPKNAYFGRFGGVFWQGQPPENQLSRKMPNLLSFTLY